MNKRLYTVDVQLGKKPADLHSSSYCLSCLFLFRELDVLD